MTLIRLQVLANFGIVENCTRGDTCHYLHICWMCKLPNPINHPYSECKYREQAVLDKEDQEAAELLNKFKCNICGILFTGSSQQQSHEQGKSHQTKLKNLQLSTHNTDATMNINAQKSSINNNNSDDVDLLLLSNKEMIRDKSIEIHNNGVSLFCNLCRKAVGSLHQSLQHVNSKPHKDKLDKEKRKNIRIKIKSILILTINSIISKK